MENQGFPQICIEKDGMKFLKKNLRKKSQKRLKSFQKRWLIEMVSKEIVLVWKGNKLPCEDCDIIFKDKFNEEHKVKLSRLIRVFNNNIWQHKKSIK